MTVSIIAQLRAPLTRPAGDFLPCPFCGHTPVITGRLTVFVECRGCDARGPVVNVSGGMAADPDLPHWVATLAEARRMVTDLWNARCPP